MSHCVLFPQQINLKSCSHLEYKCIIPILVELNQHRFHHSKSACLLERWNEVKSQLEKFLFLSYKHHFSKFFWSKQKNSCLQKCDVVCINCTQAECKSSYQFCCCCCLYLFSMLVSSRIYDYNMTILLLQVTFLRINSVQLFIKSLMKNINPDG